MEYISNSPAETEALGEALAARLDRLCRPAMGLNEGEKERYTRWACSSTVIMVLWGYREQQGSSGVRNSTGSS